MDPKLMDQVCEVMSNEDIPDLTTFNADKAQAYIQRQFNAVESGWAGLSEGLRLLWNQYLRYHYVYHHKGKKAKRGFQHRMKSNYPFMFH
jgi:hypothetical protein